jgi:hypothetical protein
MISDREVLRVINEWSGETPDTMSQNLEAWWSHTAANHRRVAFNPDGIRDLVVRLKNAFPNLTDIFANDFRSGRIKTVQDLADALQMQHPERVGRREPLIEEVLASGSRLPGSDLLTSVRRPGISSGIRKAFKKAAAKKGGRKALVKKAAKKAASRPRREAGRQAFRGEPNTTPRRPVAPKKHPEPARPRHLQVQVENGATGKNAFQAGTKHRIHVRVGTLDGTWITDARTFDESTLPPSKTGHKLKVIFVEPQFMRKPQVSSIHLPPEGPSTTCTFQVAVPPMLKEIEARIVLMHRNRVLQTALLKGKADGRSAPEIEPEVVVNPGLTALNSQPEYDAALVFNHTGRAGKVMGVVGEKAALISTAPLDGLIQKLEDTLSTADWGEDDFHNLNGEGTVLLLRKLAGHGRNLLKNLEKELEGIKTARHIQLVAAKPGARLPVEYFYSYPVPAEPWKLCPNALKSLQAGACRKNCGAIKNCKKYICPLGFWGLSKVLEWQSYRPASARELEGADYKLQETPAVERKRLGPLSKAVVAASARASAEQKDAVSSLVKYIESAKINVSEARTWAEWEKKIKSSPSLLLLLPHTDLDQKLDQPKMEIGKGQWLTLDRLEKDYVSSGRVRPIVLLLGCETGQQHVAFEDFISNFMSGGAAIVVSSATTILGRHAAPVAREFIKIMMKRKNEAATFGDVMLQVRRSMMCRGFPMVMSISSYGDADWRLYVQDPHAARRLRRLALG